MQKERLTGGFTIKVTIGEESPYSSLVKIFFYNFESYITFCLPKEALCVMFTQPYFNVSLHQCYNNSLSLAVSLMLWVCLPKIAMFLPAL